MNVKSRFPIKFLAVFLAIALIAISVPIPQASANLDQRVEASTGTGTPGDEVQIDFLSSTVGINEKAGKP